MPKCEHEGCTERGNIYVIEGYEPPAPDFCFCDQHAAEFGFCLTCGAFIGGTEDVFLVGQEGLCFDCYTQMKREIEGDDDFDDNDAWEY